MSRRLYTEASVRALPPGSELVLGGGAIATPAALELAFARGIPVQWGDGSKTPGSGRSEPGDSLWQKLLSEDGEYVVQTKGGQARVFRLAEGGPVLIGEGASVVRRFLTAEDVRRAQGAEILVDEGTMVTPQAQEAAELAGITIRTGEGDWKEPVPDRGPDSDTTRQRLPHLPEPQDNPALESTAIVTAVGKNHPGVLAAITAKVAELRGNVNDVSQKVVEGYFHMILTVELEPGVSFDDFKTTLECLSSPEDFAVRVMNERIFRFMHRV